MKYRWTKTSLPSKLVRWALGLLEYDFEVRHRNLYVVTLQSKTTRRKTDFNSITAHQLASLRWVPVITILLKNDRVALLSNEGQVDQFLLGGTTPYSGSKSPTASFIVSSIRFLTPKPLDFDKDRSSISVSLLAKAQRNQEFVCKCRKPTSETYAWASVASNDTNSAVTVFCQSRSGSQGAFARFGMCLCCLFWSV